MMWSVVQSGAVRHGELDCHGYESVKHSRTPENKCFRQVHAETRRKSGLHGPKRKGSVRVSRIMRQQQLSVNGGAIQRFDQSSAVKTERAPQV